MSFAIFVEPGHEDARPPRPVVFRLGCACGREFEGRDCLLAFRAAAAAAGWRIRDEAVTCPPCERSRPGGALPGQRDLFGDR